MALRKLECESGVSDENFIKEALEFCDDELAGFKGFDLSRDRHYACIHAENYIRNLASRLKNRKVYYENGK